MLWEGEGTRYHTNIEMLASGGDTNIWRYLYGGYKYFEIFVLGDTNISKYLKGGGYKYFEIFVSPPYKYFEIFVWGGYKI